MRGLAILVVLTFVLDRQSCFAFYKVSCLPHSMKGLFYEEWYKSKDSNIDSLEDVKFAILEEVKPDVIKNETPTRLSLNFQGNEEETGRRWRGFFVCSMTGEYEFYFSCEKACEWFLMEAGDNSSTHLVGGNSSAGMSTAQFIKAELSVNLTEGRAYYFEVIHYSDDEGHLIFKTRGPGEETASNMSISQLVAYKEDGYYDTLHPGEWEAWSPCSSTPCGPDGRQTRDRSCLTHPVMFNYSTDGYVLSQSRTCNSEVMPFGEVPITAPSNVRGHNTRSTSIRVEWDDALALDENCTIMSYNITYHSLTENHSDSITVNYSVRQETLKDLKEFVSYCIRVFASTKKGDGPASNPIIVRTDQDKPTAAPLNVTGHNTSSTSILVEWGDVPAFDQNGIITSYNITYSSQTENLNGFAEAAPIDRRKELTGLRKFVNYNITVRASTSKGDGPESSPIVVRTGQDKPTAAPLNVTGHNTSSTSILVEWGDVPAFDQNGIITSYNITYSSQTENLNGFAEAAPIDRQKELTGLRKFVNYNITPFSSTFISEPTAAPLNVTGHNTSSTSILVEWGDVPAFDQNGIITSYNITYSSQTENLNGFAEAAPIDRQKELTGLRKFVNYNITVRASTSKGDGPDSSPIVVRTDQDKPTAAPLDVTGYNTSSTSILVEWGDVPAFDQNGIITSYNITYSSQTENLNGFAEAAPIDRQKELTGLRKFVNYNITVRASTSKGDGPDSSPIVVRTDQDKPTAAPLNVTGHNTSSTSILVEWGDVPAFDQNGIITSYNITYSSQTENLNGFAEAAPIDRQKELTGLRKFVNYNITVRASTSKGNGPDSSPIVVRTDQDKPTAAPLNVTGHNTSSTSILVEWGDVPAFDQNGIITSYNITYSSQTENLNGFAEAGPIDRKKELKGLRKFVNYNITVCASTSKGDGPDSSPIVVRTDQDIPDLPPEGITAHGTSPVSIKVSWKPVPEGHENGVILGYRILFADAAEFREERHLFDVPFNFSSLEVNGLTRFTNYCVQVFAFTEKGDGNMSDCLYALTAMGVPSLAPSNISAFSSDGSTVNLSWNAVPEREGEVEIVGYAIIINGSEYNTIRFVASCSSPLLLKNVSFSDDTCIHMAALSIDGFGILSDCTIIKVPTGSGGGKRNIPPMTYTTKSMSSSSIRVNLQNVAEKKAAGKLEGFYISYQAVSRGGEPVPDLLSEPNYTMTVCAGASEVTLTGLMTYTTYKIEVALVTSKGVEEFSEPLYAETCRCSEKLSVSLVPNSLDSLGPVSLTRVIHDLVISTCGTCVAHRHTKLVSSNITQDNQVSFPVTRTQTIGDTAYSKFVPAISFPGFVVVKRRDSPIPTFTKLLTTSIFDSWPVCVLALLTALLAGIIIWILDSKTNPEHFPRTFFKGAGAGFWWSFITMSTVGYGDRCPQSVPAKVFSIVWFLIGLVIFTLFHGTLTSLLTVTVIRIQMDANGLSSFGGGKVAVVSNSSSHQVAVKKFPNKLAIGSVFTDVNSMVEALRSGNISSVLLDMYVPVKRKDLFNGSWFHVSEFLEGEIVHGILLQGEGVNLAKELKNLIKTNNVEAQFLKQDEKGTEESKETESTSAVFFEPSSPYFLNTMVISVGLLLLAVTCGLFYQACCYRLCCKRARKGTCRCRIMKQDIAESLEAFHRNFSQTYHRLRERQIQQLQQTKESRRAISKETSTSYDSDEVLAIMY
ncbi:phosphatidylinositol phosphatase PTPRQ-like [Stylophora pistillata]|uniref:phosphatidylinositol phosphatase PTPRQ-like n=1 Tax=Stylophora pistillata TaxID=50429 RepID=UPI000C03A14A|nr:phosphatidylinositol phosphatase PTPRQ-like [Stylophora pistillata]